MATLPACACCSFHEETPSIPTPWSWPGGAGETSTPGLAQDTEMSLYLLGHRVILKGSWGYAAMRALGDETPCGREKPHLRVWERLSWDFQPSPPLAGCSPIGNPSQDNMEPSQPTESWGIIHFLFQVSAFLRGFLQEQCRNTEPKHRPSPLTAPCPSPGCLLILHTLLWLEYSYSFFKTQLTAPLSQMRKYRHTHSLLEGIKISRIRFSCLWVKK